MQSNSQSMHETDFNLLEKPSAQDTYDALKHRKKEVKTGGPGRPDTNQTQINIKLTLETKATFLDMVAKLQKAKLYRTRGAVFADMVDDLVSEHSRTPAPKPAKSTKPEKPAKAATRKPSAGDLAGDRTEHRDIFFQPGLIEMLEAHSGNQTVSEFLQNLVEAGFSARALKAQNDDLRAQILTMKGAQ
jgi:hypothetical protein